MCLRVLVYSAFNVQVSQINRFSDVKLTLKAFQLLILN